MKRFLAVLASAALAVVLPAGDALAGRARVDVSIKAADTTVAPSDTIVITGAADSAKRKCYKKRTVELFVDGSPVGTDSTSRKGKYRFEFPGPHPSGPHKFETKIASKRGCKASRPNTVTVTVN